MRKLKKSIKCFVFLRKIVLSRKISTKDLGTLSFEYGVNIEGFEKDLKSSNQSLSFVGGRDEETGR